MSNVMTRTVGFGNLTKEHKNIPNPEIGEDIEGFMSRCITFFRIKGEDQLAGKKVCNFIWNNYQEKLLEKARKEVGKPKILMICDVKNWAWWNKSEYIKKYLSDDFDIDLMAALENGKIDETKYDFYFTFGFSYIDILKKVSFFKKITGVTAHRPLPMIEKQMKKAHFAHANSILLFNELKKFHNNVFYVPNGVDEVLFNNKKPIPIERDNIIVGHVGKMFKDKGQQEFIIPAIEKSGAESIMNTSDYKNMVKFDEMPNVYNNIDVFVVASVEDGTPNPALEAAACGRPIISNAIGNMPEFIKDGYNGFIVERKVEAYVEKIDWLRKNRDKMIKMGLNARETVEKGWTWKIQAENYRKMFKKMVDINNRKVSASIDLKNRVPNIKPSPSFSNISELEALKLIQDRAKEKNEIRISTGKPSILILVDVAGWAWDAKAHQIQKWLSKDFDIFIRYYQSSFRTFKSDEKFDLYFSFDCNSVRHFNHIAKDKKITGITSHTYTSFSGNYKNMLNSAKYVHANSMLLYNELSKIHPNVFYVPNGVDEEMFNLKIRNTNGEFVVGYVGKNTIRKGYEKFIIPACKKADVVLRPQVCRFNSPNVIKHKDIHNFYADVDCIIIASDMDGTPNQLLEAAASGRTFVGNEIGNVPEFVNDGVNGFLVQREVNAYVDKLNWLKDHREECVQMGLEARKTIEKNWTWKIQAENYGKMFEEALKG